MDRINDLEALSSCCSWGFDRDRTFYAPRLVGHACIGRDPDGALDLAARSTAAGRLVL